MRHRQVCARGHGVRAPGDLDQRLRGRDHAQRSPAGPDRRQGEQRCPSQGDPWAAATERSEIAALGERMRDVVVADHSIDRLFDRILDDVGTLL